MTKKIKETEYSYIVNLDDIETLEDVNVVWALAKQSYNQPLTDDELLSIIEHVAEHAAPKFTICVCENKCDCKCEKKPWYKRLWNWICRKK